MPSDAEVVEVLARALEIVASDGGCNAHEIARDALTALHSAGYAVVKAGELGALVETARLARDALKKISADNNWEPPHPRGTTLDAALIPFTKDPTNAQ